MPRSHHGREALEVISWDLRDALAFMVLSGD